MVEPNHESDPDRGLVWLAMLGAATVVAAMVAGKAARDAILLAHYNVRWLPLFVGAAAVASFPGVLIIGKLIGRYGPMRLVPLLNAGSAALAVFEWAFMRVHPHISTIIIFFHLSTFGAMLVSGFWSIINERFDVQTAKRHIGRIGMGATLGGIGGGLLATGTAIYLPSSSIVLVLAGLQLASAVLLHRLGHSAPHASIPAGPTGAWSAIGVVAKSKLLRHVAVIVILGAAAACVMDYIFKFSIADGTQPELLQSLSVYYTVISVITAIVQIVIGSTLVTKLGVPRSVATLPITVTAFSALAIAVPSALSAAIARGAEAVTRNSIYRAAYELLFAPMPEEHKRPTKVLLDVGAERIGDMLGAQLVGAIVYFVAVPVASLKVAGVAIGAITCVLALRLRKSYTEALEQSLLARAADALPAQDPWLDGSPTLGAAGDLTALTQLHIRRRTGPRPKRQRPRARALAARLLRLHSSDPRRLKRELAQPLEPELLTHVLELANLAAVKEDALAALVAIAPQCTGALVDALLDQGLDLAIRRHVPAILVTGEPEHASWGLWRGLADPTFEIRYGCGAALARIASEGRLANVATEQVFDAVRRELLVGHEAWSAYQPADAESANLGLDHVFTVLGLVLPAEPLRIALQAVKTDDPLLRGTAIEYLESILPTDVRVQLWPFLEIGEAPAAAEPAREAKPRAPDELLDTLRASFTNLVPVKHA